MCQKLRAFKGEMTLKASWESSSSSNKMKLSSSVFNRSSSQLSNSSLSLSKSSGSMESGVRLNIINANIK